MNHYENHTSEASVTSPIYTQIEQLDQRLESTYAAFTALLQKISPILSSQPDTGKTPSPREVGASPLHDRLLTLNEKASNFARAVAEANSRVTV